MPPPDEVVLTLTVPPLPPRPPSAPAATNTVVLWPPSPPRPPLLLAKIPSSGGKIWNPRKNVAEVEMLNVLKLTVVVSVLPLPPALPLVGDEKMFSENVALSPSAPLAPLADSEMPDVRLPLSAVVALMLSVVPDTEGVVAAHVVPDGPSVQVTWASAFDGDAARHAAAHSALQRAHARSVADLTRPDSLSARRLSQQGSGVRAWLANRQNTEQITKKVIALRPPLGFVADLRERLVEQEEAQQDRRGLRVRRSDDRVSAR